MKKVTTKHAMNMLEVLPPATWYKTKNGEVFQVGEAFDHNSEGMARFATYERRIGQWYYRGVETKHLKKKNLMESEAYSYIQ